MRIPVSPGLLAVGLTLSAPAEAPAPLLAPAQQREVLTRVVTLVREEYVLPEVAETTARGLGERLEAEGLDRPRSPEAFLRLVNAHLEALTGDRHVRMRVAVPRFDEPTGDFGLKAAERLEGGIGYLRIDRFYGAEESRAALEAALDKLGPCRAVVVDLRANQGGGDAQVQLASYFLPERVLLARLRWRKREPLDFWAGPSTRPDLVKVPLYVLTSARTFSAGEAFAYNLQQRGRAVVVGEVSRGGANPNRFFPLPHGLELSLSVGRTENPVSGTNWEGVGVKPDLAVPAAEALEAVKRRVAGTPGA